MRKGESPRVGLASTCPSPTASCLHATVTSYCKRHLAQEERNNAEKDPEELEQTKSYRSLVRRPVAL